MRTLKYLLFCSILIISFPAIGLHSAGRYTPLSLKETDDYQLVLDESKISALKDTVFGRDKCLITHCPLKLINNSNNTLKYLAMSASWWDLFTLDNNNFALAADYWNVFKNGIIVRAVPPHQSVVTLISIITYKAYRRGQKLKIGMSLQKSTSNTLTLMPKTTNLIWSNEVTIN